MRVVHLTDLHVQRAPGVTDLRPKRMLGTANLYLGGRRSHFSETVQQAAVQAAIDLAPDLTLITGDLTAQALDVEFQAAHQLLSPLAGVAPLYLIPGNHDLYVNEAIPGTRMRSVLGEWMSDGSPGLARFGQVSALYIETCQPTWLSDGATNLAQLSRADQLLHTADGFVFLCVHYPLRGRRGEPYGPARRANQNAADIEAWLRRQTKVGAILHGHEHHGFRTTVPGASGDIPILNPGASGYAWLPQKRRTAHFNVYTVEEGVLTHIDRYAWNGRAFELEAGGAYSSGG